MYICGIIGDLNYFYMKITHGSLFSGLGGFDLAAEWAGWDNKFHCEWNEFGKRILNYYWPNAKSYDDITKTDFTIWGGKIDIISGGFPCQPFSVAGKRQGTADERHLWPEMLRAVREIQPSWVVGENVSGLINWDGGLVFEQVQADLEAEGYQVWANVLPAASVNAPHKRDRVWFVSFKNTNSDGWDCNKREEKYCIGKFGDFAAGDYEPIPTNNDEIRNATDSKSESSGGKHEQRQREREFGRCDCKGDVTNANGTRFQKKGAEQQSTGFEQHGELGVSFTNTSNQGLQRSEKHRSLRESRKDGNQLFTRCVPSTWKKFPTQSPICDGDDGLSTQLDAITFPKWRTESVKAGGNAIVPQVAYQIFKAINEYMNNHN